MFGTKEQLIKEMDIFNQAVKDYLKEIK